MPKLEAALNEEHARFVETSITADELRAELEERGRIIEGMTRELEALRKKEQGIAELSRLVEMAACCAALSVFMVLQLAHTLSCTGKATASDHESAARSALHRSPQSRNTGQEPGKLRPTHHHHHQRHSMHSPPPRSIDITPTHQLWHRTWLLRPRRMPFTLNVMLKGQ